MGLMWKVYHSQVSNASSNAPGEPRVPVCDQTGRWVYQGLACADVDPVEIRQQQCQARHNTGLGL